MADIQTNYLNELDFQCSTIVVHYGLLTKDLMADIQTDHLLGSEVSINFISLGFQ